MNNILLRNHGGIIVEVNDNFENAIAIIKYVDHGDEFLVVKTQDGIYEYGWFLNRKWYPDYKSIINDPNRYVGENKTFISAPKLYYKEDYHSMAANKIFLYTEDLTTWGTKRYEWISRYHAYDFYSSPQQAFDSYIDDIKEIYDGKKSMYGDWYYGHTYHFDNYTTDKIERFLKRNNIYENNISKLNDIKKYLRIDEIDGCAGTINTDSDIYGDDIIFIIHRGKNINIDNVVIDNYSEEEFRLGEFDRFSLDINQFD